MRLLRAEGRAVQPWQNGGGTTREVARWPRAGDFDWRVSIAEIARAGPFSTFAGIARTLVVMEGALDMRMGPEEALVPLDACSPPIAFTGDTLLWAAPRAGSAIVLNLMVRPERIEGQVSRLAAGTEHRRVSDDVTLMIAQAAAEVSLPAERLTLARHDAILLDRGDADVATIAASSEVVIIDLRTVLRAA